MSHRVTPPLLPFFPPSLVDLGLFRDGVRPHTGFQSLPDESLALWADSQYESELTFLAKVSRVESLIDGQRAQRPRSTNTVVQPGRLGLERRTAR